MHPDDKQKILDRYASRIEQFGHGAAALGEPKERQAFYFDFLLQVDSLEATDSILDVGCGYGDLYSYLKSQGWHGEYLGVDINPALIEEGSRRYPEAELRVMDIQTEQPGRMFDWCFCCHALTSDTQKVPFPEHLEEMLSIMWGCCKKGLIFNLLSPLSDFRNPIHARLEFSSVLPIVVKLTNRFVLRHDYM